MPASVQKLEVGVVLFHSPHEADNRLKQILTQCNSSTLHRLIEEIPKADIPKGTSKTRLRNSCRYSERYKTTYKTWGNGHKYPVHDRTKPTPTFMDTASLIVQHVPTNKLLGMLFDMNEMKWERINVKDARVVGEYR
jgi:hypothetical protein